MKSRLLSICALGAAGCLAVAGAAPQANPQAAPAGQAAAQTQLPKQNIDAATARKMVAAAEAAAAAANAHVAITVVDANGDLVYFERMDGAAPRAVTSSQGKARAALVFGVPTKDIQDSVVNGKPLSATLSAPIAGAWELTFVQGGLPIMKDGKMIAAVACGGSSSANDEKFAQAGIDALSAK